MAEVYVDPYIFSEEEYEPIPGTEDFSESFLEELRCSDSGQSELEFAGFDKKNISSALGSRVREFHFRRNEAESPDKEETEPRQGKKRKRDPSR